MVPIILGNPQVSARALRQWTSGEEPLAFDAWMEAEKNIKQQEPVDHICFLRRASP